MAGNDVCVYVEEDGGGGTGCLRGGHCTKLAITRLERLRRGGGATTRLRRHSMLRRHRHSRGSRGRITASSTPLLLLFHWFVDEKRGRGGRGAALILWGKGLDLRWTTTKQIQEAATLRVIFFICFMFYLNVRCTEKARQSITVKLINVLGHYNAHSDIVSKGMCLASYHGRGGG
jgi:hypothetical protein